MDEEKEGWRDRVDSVVLYDRVEEIRARLKELERIVLVGKDSLRSEYRRHDQELARLNAVLFMDPTGQKGLLHDVDVLMGRRRDKDETRGLKWQFWGAILVATITTAGLILTNLPKIKETLLQVDPLEKRISQAKHPKVKRIYRIRHVQAEAPSDDTKASPPSQEK